MYRNEQSFSNFSIFSNSICTLGTGILLSLKSGWPIWVRGRKLSVVRCSIFKHPVDSLHPLPCMGMHPI